MHFSRSTIQSRCVAANQPGNDSASPKTTYLYYTDEGYAAEYTHNGNHPNSEASITPTLSQLYLFAPQGLWSTEPVAIKQSGDTPGWRYPETDHLGTPHGLISKAGEETTDLRANAFGQTEVSGEPLALRFAGQMEDRETGAYYNFHRDYEPDLGRYRESDPIGLRGGINMFGYVDGNPENSHDSLGLSGSRPGGPYHPPNNVSTKCRPGDSCTKIIGKLWVLATMITSHTLWDRRAGSARHATEIADLWTQYAKCLSMAYDKCGDACKKIKIPLPSIPIIVHPCLTSGIGCESYGNDSPPREA